MLHSRLSVRLGEKQLHSAILGISHLIEQQYAQKLSDEQFEELQQTLNNVHQRGLNASIIPWFDSFRWNHTGTTISHSVSSAVVLGDTSPGNIRTEMMPKDPTNPLNLFIDHLLKKAEKIDEDGTPLMFMSLSDRKKFDICLKIVKVMNDNMLTIYKEEELCLLAKACYDSIETPSSFGQQGKYIKELITKKITSLA